MPDRIVVLGPSAERYKGGIAQFTSRLCAACDERAAVLFLSWYQQYPSFLSRRDFEDRVSADRVSPIGADFVLGYMNPLSWFRAFRKIVSFKPTKVVCTWTHPVHAPIYILLLLFLRFRLVAERILLCHNVLPHESVRGGRLLTRMVLALADRVVVHGKSESIRVGEFAPDTPCTTLFLPLFDTLDHETGEAMPPEVHRLLFFGLIRDYKGLDLLLRAVAVLREEYPDIQLHIAGEPFDDVRDAPVLELITELDIEKHVIKDIRYIPNEEVSALFQRASVAVFPYRSATQSGVVATAYANNTPVIATRVGGIPDMVAHGVSGYLVEPESVEALAEGIRLFFKQPILREQVHAYAAQFSWSRYVDALLVG